MQYLKKAKEAVKDAIFVTTGITTAVTIGSIYLGVKTAFNTIKLPASLAFHSYKSIKHAKDCCKTIFQSIEHNHKECFDHFYQELDFDLAVQAITESMDNIDPPQIIRIYMLTIDESMEEEQIKQLSEYRKIKSKIEQNEADQICINFLQFDEDKIKEQIKQNTKLRKYDKLVEYSFFKFKILLEQRYHKKNYINRKYKYNSFVSFIDGCLNLFQTSEMLSHVLSKIPLRCFDERKILYVYQIFHNKNQVDICQLLSPDKDLYTPILEETTCDSKFESLYKKFSNIFDFEDKHNIFDEKIVLSNKNNLLTKEELDRCIQLHYNTEPPYSFFEACLFRSNSLYLRSFLHFYGELESDKNIMISATEETRENVAQIVNSSIFKTKGKRTDTQQFIMNEFLNEIKRNQYIDSSIYEHKNILRGVFIQDMKDKYQEKRSNIIEKIDDSQVDICKDIANIITDYAL